MREDHMIAGQTRHFDGSSVFGDETPLSHIQMLNTWTRISKKIDFHDTTLHTLRHSFLTMASNSGIEPKTIQAIAEYAAISITMNRYVHAQIEPIKRAGATLGQKTNSLRTSLEHFRHFCKNYSSFITQTQKRTAETY